MPRQILSTYRVQLRAEFDFDAAAAVADYLSALGVSHLYCSPYLQAATGSTRLAGDWGDTTIELPPGGQANLVTAGDGGDAGDPGASGAGGDPEATEGARDTANPGSSGQWWNELTGETFAAGTCRAADLLGRFPVALLSWLATGEDGPDLGGAGR